MKIFSFIKDITVKHRRDFGALEVIKYIGPGLLVTVGFTDPGNWASNVAAGSDFGYKLLGIVTLSTIMLVILQHNTAHLGISTGLCLAEAATIHTRKWVSSLVLFSAMCASVATSFAEILGAAIALNMLLHVPIIAGALLTVIFVCILMFANAYKSIEKWIISFVSIIGLSFIYELSLIHIDWGDALVSAARPSIPQGSMIIIMSVLGAVVMPHNLFLHSEIIQSRQWNLESEKLIKKQLRFEFLDTLFSMILGWAINCAMIILAAATFYKSHLHVTELPQAEHMLHPLLGDNAAGIFAIALLFSGIASTVTSGIAAGSIFSGIFGEPYHMKDTHSRTGIGISFILALIIIFMIHDPFRGLILSQMILSIQLPITIYMQIYLTSSKKVMGTYANNRFTKFTLYIIGAVVTLLNIILLISII